MQNDIRPHRRNQLLRRAGGEQIRLMPGAWISGPSAASDRMDIGATLQQRANGMAPDEAGCAGEENACPISQYLPLRENPFKELSPSAVPRRAIRSFREP
jgi:hypothetical protein